MHDSDYRSQIYRGYRSSGYGDANPDSPSVERSRHEGYLSDFGDFLPGDRSVRILDIGCGSGFLLKFLRDMGYRNLTGLETSADQVEFSRSQGFHVLHADALEFFRTSSLKFDVIFMTDVLEHLRKDELLELVEGVKQALESSGQFVFRTINASSIYSGTLRYIDLTHELSFTEPSVTQLLRTTGFTQITITDNKVPFGWRPRRFVRWTGMKILRWVQKAIFTLEVGTDRPRLYGKFLIVVATKL